jgi:hypothetical protein
MVEAVFNNIRSKILKELDNAKSSISIAMYWFTNEELFNKLMNCLLKGVKIDLIIHNDYINNRSSGLNFRSFIKSGGQFYFSTSLNPMHNKFCVIDDHTLINGSYNWTYYAEDKNRENILIIKDEIEVISSFINEFSKLKKLTERIKVITPLTSFEVDEFNNLRARNYLANDIVYQAKSTGRKEIVEDAFKIAPDNIEIQKTAFHLNLTKKYRLIHSIGSSLKGNRYLIVLPKGSFIPFTNTEIIQTSANYQRSCSCKVYYGEKNWANGNKYITSLSLHGIPPKPVGEAKMKLHFTIDIYGNLKMVKFSLDSGSSVVASANIKGILEEVFD